MIAQNDSCVQRKNMVFKKIYFCSNPLSRLRGVFFRREFSDQHAVLLEGCSSVHGVGIARALDIVFLNAHNQVLEVSSLKPFGICFHLGAKKVLELRSGIAKRYDITTGDYLHLDCEDQGNQTILCQGKYGNQKHQSGASMVEFLLAAPLLIYFGTGIVQMGMAYHARNILDYATFEAARVGAVHQADITKMRGELAYRLGPIFPGDGSSTGVRSAVTDAIAAVNDPFRTHIRIVNPTSAAFEDFGVNDPDTGEVVLPSTHLQHRSSDIGAQSMVTIQDANLLKIEITHGYELRLPWLDIKLPGIDFVLKELMTLANPQNAQYYARGQIPLRAVATVRMQSDAKANNVQAASDGVTRPNTDELGEGELPLADSVVEDSEFEQTDVNNESEENQSEACVGSHGLPANLAIETISGELEDEVCAYLPPDTPVSESPLPVESNSDASVTC